MEKSLKEIGIFFGHRTSKEDVATHAACDSRKAQKGTLFFALSGEKVDGHMFLKEVAAKGGVGAVVSEGYRGESYGMELFRTADVKKALQDYAKEVFKGRNQLVIGVTGTVGKTTTKEFLATLLEEKFRVEKNLGSMNSQIGLPLTLLNSDGQGEIIVLEMGMSQKGELSRLVEIAPPHLGVLTKLTLVHSAFFKSLEEIAEAKCELFTSSKIERGFFHLETAPFKAVQNLNILKTWFPMPKGVFPQPFKESHLLENFLGAASVAHYLGLSQEEIERGAKKLKLPEHRFQKVEKKGVLFIDDSYNASPEAAKAAFSNLPKGKKQIAVFGGMKELGDFEEESHRALAEHALPLIDHLICIGKECLPMVEVFKKGGKPVDFFTEKESAGIRLKEVMKEGDVVLLKGSNSSRLWTLLEEI